MLMVFVVWWYSTGWWQQVSFAESKLIRLVDSFSIVSLAKSWFSPYRQLSAGGVRGPLGVQLRAWADRTISRFIGAMLRSVVIIAGVTSLVVMTIVYGFWLALWPLLPLAPLIGGGLWLNGWLPWVA